MVESLWEEEVPHATKLMIVAYGGGSNGTRSNIECSYTTINWRGKPLRLI